MAPDTINYEGSVNLRTKTEGFFGDPEEWLKCDFTLCGNMLHYRASQLPRTTSRHFWGIVYLDEVLELLPTISVNAKQVAECRLKIRGKTNKTKWKLVFCTASPGELAAWMKHLSNGCNPHNRQQMPTTAGSNVEEIEAEATEEEDNCDECGEYESTEGSVLADKYEVTQLLQSTISTSNSKPVLLNKKVLLWPTSEPSPVALTGFRERRASDFSQQPAESKSRKAGTVENDLSDAEEEYEIEDCSSTEEILSGFDGRRFEDSHIDGRSERKDATAPTNAKTGNDDISSLLHYVAEQIPKVDQLGIHRVANADSKCDIVVMATAEEVGEDHPAVQRHQYYASSPSSIVELRPNRHHAVDDQGKINDLGQRYAYSQRYSYSKRKAMRQAASVWNQPVAMSFGTTRLVFAFNST